MWQWIVGIVVVAAFVYAWQASKKITIHQAREDGDKACQKLSVLNPTESDRVIPFKMTGKSH